MNNTRHDAMLKVMDVCTDDAEVLALSIIRFVAAGYSTGDVACWDLAYSGAGRVVGPEEGGKLVAGLTTLVRAVRTERTQGWNFMPATCCRMTADEAAIVRLMTTARRRDAREIGRAASDLTHASESPCTEAAARDVACTLDRVAGALSRAAQQGGPVRFH